MAKQATRQRIRKALIIVSLLLFPVILNYLSPYVIIVGASQGVVNGSMISFGLMFVGSLFLGRLWCGWACPGAGLQEVAFEIVDRPLRSAKLDWVKWIIWVIWLGIIAAIAISAGGYRQVNPLFLTETGVSVTEPMQYIIYYIVLATFLGIALIAGRRGACHMICWMAPFMILGRKLRNLFAWPSLRLKAETSKCINCKKCTTNCPMSLDVNALVQKGAMEHSECILCGTCVDVCPKEVIHYSFSAGK